MQVIREINRREVKPEQTRTRWTFKVKQEISQTTDRGTRSQNKTQKTQGNQESLPWPVQTMTSAGRVEAAG